jgi:hypothetical protein
MDDKFARLKQKPSAFGRIGIIQVKLANRQIEGRLHRGRVGFNEWMRAPGDNDDLPPHKR